MSKKTQNSKLVRNRAMQFLIAMIAVLIVGNWVASLAVMNELLFMHKLSFHKLIVFVTHSIALILFFLAIRFGSKTISTQNNSLIYLGLLMEPAAILIMAILGQDILWQLVNPFVSVSGKSFYFSMAIGIILISALWLIYCAYRESPELILSLEQIPGWIKKKIDEQSNLCNHCQHKNKRSSTYCSQCGYLLSTKVSCKHCDNLVDYDQKFCDACGHSMSGKNNFDDFEIDLLSEGKK